MEKEDATPTARCADTCGMVVCAPDNEFHATQASGRTSMLDGNNSCISENLLRVVVDQLPVDENIDALSNDLLTFGLHLGLLCLLNFSNAVQAVGLHTSTIHLDLVGVHGCVCDENLGILNTGLLAHTDLLIQDESLNTETLWRHDCDMLPVCRDSALEIS